MSERFKVECGSCGATGLYKGFAEPPGTAVICNQCRGKGYKIVATVMEGANLFTGRKRKEGITKVMTDGGLWMLRSHSTPTISIEQFNTVMDNEQA